MQREGRWRCDGPTSWRRLERSDGIVGFRLIFVVVAREGGAREIKWEREVRREGRVVAGLVATFAVGEIGGNWD